MQIVAMPTSLVVMHLQFGQLYPPGGHLPLAISPQTQSQEYCISHFVFF